MFDTKTVSIQWGGKTLTLETGRVARQADGAVLATLGETVVLCAVTAARSVKEGQDFFPLTVHYQEKFSASGRIPGGFFKRERGATEKETLTSRLIDRPIRPLFPEGFYNEILVIAQVLSYDGENEPDVLAMIAASAALTLSGVPFMGPIAGARVGYSNAREKAKEAFAEADPQEQLVAQKAIKGLEADIVRGAILKEGRRIDGRDTKTVRPIDISVGFLPRTHGSALFTRGETQSIVSTTLGAKECEQMIDGPEGLSYPRSMLYYNFPPYPVGEVGRFGAPGRREVGHGKLAWRALHPMLPSMRSSRTRSAFCPTSPSPTGRARWPRCAAVRRR